MCHFVRMSWFVRILVALFVCVAASRASFAQGESWYAECPACAQHLGGSGVIGPFATWDACDKARRDEANRGFPGFTTCHTGSPSSASQMRWLTPGAAVIGSTVVFGAGGGLTGTFWNNPQGQTFGYGGAALGAGTFGFAALALNARKMSRPAVVFTSALDFAAIGAGTAQAVQFRQEWANPQAPALNNRSIVIGAAFGAAAGTMIGLLLPHKTGTHDHVTKTAASDTMANLSEDRKRRIFLRKLHSSDERGSPIDAPLPNDISDRSAYNYFKVIEQFRVEDKESRRYKPGDATYCNIFVWDVTRAMGFEIPHWVTDDRGKRHEMRVNELAGWLNEKGKKQGWTHVDARMAQQMANEGHPSIAIWENPDSSISGHIAVIRPGSVGDERGAAISQAGRLVLDAKHIETGFNDPDHEKRIQYWYHE